MSDGLLTREGSLGQNSNYVLRLIGQEQIVRLLEFFEATPLYFNMGDLAIGF